MPDSVEIAGGNSPTVDELPAGKGVFWVDDHKGESYLTILRRLHEVLNLHTYLEIGCDVGASLALARCAALGIDPRHHIKAEAAIGAKPVCAIYRITSDDFFARWNPKIILGAPIDMAFLDGLHLCEYLLRDFINTERHVKRNSIIVMHDCLPTEWPMAERQYIRSPLRAHHLHSWTGDVWRTALLLKGRRPDLEITAYDAPPTGLVCITNLNPKATSLADDYQNCVREMHSQSLKDLGISALFAKMRIESTTVLKDKEAIASRFWV